VEALGQARIIAVDKTGTVTKNEMLIQKIYVDGKFFNIGGVGYEPKVEIRYENKIINPSNHQGFLLAGEIAAFCSNARVMFSEEEKIWRIAGDPTDAAMLVFAKKLGFSKDNLEKEFLLISEIPFDYKLKYHVTVHKENDQKFLAIVGSPEIILGLSEKVWRAGKSQYLLNKEKEKLESVFFVYVGGGVAGYCVSSNL